MGPVGAGAALRSTAFRGSQAASVASPRSRIVRSGNRLGASINGGSSCPKAIAPGAAGYPHSCRSPVVRCCHDCFVSLWGRGRCAAPMSSKSTGPARPRGRGPLSSPSAMRSAIERWGHGGTRAFFRRDRKILECRGGALHCARSGVAMRTAGRRWRSSMAASRRCALRLGGRIDAATGELGRLTPLDRIRGAVRGNVSLRRDLCCQTTRCQETTSMSRRATQSVGLTGRGKQINLTVSNQESRFPASRRTP